MSKTILIVDDQALVRQGVRTLIRESHPDWNVCGEASNGKEAIEVIKTLKPDVIILDVAMPMMSGFEVASRVSTMALGTRILVFTMHASKGYQDQIRKVGAHGYVAKSRADKDLIRAIDALQSGGTFFSPST